MSPEQFIAYFENVAAQNIAIGHQPGNPKFKRFYRMDIEELTGSLDNRFNALSLVIEHPDEQEEDNLSDNPYLRQMCAYWILCPVPDKDNFDQLNTIRQRCYSVSHQVYSKLRNDVDENIYKGFKRGSFRRAAYTDMSGTVVGYRCSFEQHAPINYRLNANEWLNETPVN
jgi:hypothetical protein